MWIEVMLSLLQMTLQCKLRTAAGVPLECSLAGCHRQSKSMDPNLVTVSEILISDVIK